MRYDYDDNDDDDDDGDDNSRVRRENVRPNNMIVLGYIYRV